jgi:AraC-like DNA-binding protein
MKQNLTEYEVAHLLLKDKENNGFSYEGCFALAGYLSDLEGETGSEMDIDVVALRCDWTEYSDFITAYKDFTGCHPNAEVEDYEKEADSEGYFQTRTQVIKFKGGVLIQSF